MKLHLCTENPCPEQDREFAEQLQNGFMTEMYANSLHLRKTTVKEGACKNCGGNVMTKWKYGQLETACMQCGFEPTD